jgi:hypothetical protein
VRGHAYSPESVRSAFARATEAAIRKRSGSDARADDNQKSLKDKSFKGVRRKKTARLAGGFSGILGVLRALTPLSIRQRSEMPKKVKIKLGGHDEMRSQVKMGE